MGSLSIVTPADWQVIYAADTSLYTPQWLAAHGLNQARFIAHYGHCPAIGFARDGIVFGGAYLDGDQVHVAILPAYHGHWGLLMQRALEWVLTLRDPVYGKIHRPNQACLRWIRRLGWECIGGDAHFLQFKVSAATTPAALKRHATSKLLRATTSD